MGKGNPYQLSKGQIRAFYEDTKMFNNLMTCRYYCKCGHSVTITPKQERTFCDWCRHWVYKDPVEQQKYDEMMKERERNLKTYKFRKEMRKYL